MMQEILNLLQQIAAIPYWDREPGINDEDLNQMIDFLKEQV